MNIKRSNKIDVILVALRSPDHERLQVPLAPSILKNYLIKKAGNKYNKYINVKIIDMQEIAYRDIRKETVNNISPNFYVKKVVEEITTAKPLFIGISASVNTLNLDAKLKFEGDLLLDTLKEKQFLKKTIIGGITATLKYKKILERYNTVVALGEGEETIFEYFEYKIQQRKIDEINGIAYTSKTEVIHTVRKKIFQLSGIGIPDKASFIWGLENKAAIWVENSRGCYSHCTFCSIHNTKILPHRWRRRKLEETVAGLDTLANWYMKWKIKNDFVSTKNELSILFSDDDFMGNGLVSNHKKQKADMEFTEQLADKIICINKKYNMKIKWGISTRADAIYRNENINNRRKRERIWLKLISSGLSSVFVGIESGSKSQLKRYGKQLDIDTNMKAIKVSRKLKIISNKSSLNNMLFQRKEFLNKLFYYNDDKCRDILGFKTDFPQKIFSLLTNHTINKDMYDDLTKYWKASEHLRLYCGFIIFDPLMTFHELLENITFVSKHNITENITNPLSCLRITDSTSYKKMAENKGILYKKKENTLFYDAKFQSPIISLIHNETDNWIKSQYNLVYAIKGQADNNNINNRSKQYYLNFLQKIKKVDISLLNHLSKSIASENIDETNYLKYDSDKIKLSMNRIHTQFKKIRERQIKQLYCRLIEEKIEDINGIISARINEFYKKQLK